MKRIHLSAVLLLLQCTCSLLGAENSYVGAAAGVSTLSADARSVISPGTPAISLYKPENGPVVNLFVGRHLSDYLTVQANYVWNRNCLTLTSTRFSSQGESLYQETRNSSQQSFLGDLLLYFHDRRSFARPYLSAGTGLVRMTSRQQMIVSLVGTPTLPRLDFTSSSIALRVAVGIDLRIRDGWAFRYSFSETIRGNPISAVLSPPGQRNLANFQNLFGLVKRF